MEREEISSCSASEQEEEEREEEGAEDEKPGYSSGAPPSPVRPPRGWCP